jgi:hypothetical protein
VGRDVRAGALDGYVTTSPASPKPPRSNDVGSRWGIEPVFGMSG